MLVDLIPKQPSLAMEPKRHESHISCQPSTARLSALDVNSLHRMGSRKQDLIDEAVDAGCVTIQAGWHGQATAALPRQELARVRRRRVFPRASDWPPSADPLPVPPTVPAETVTAPRQYARHSRVRHLPNRKPAVTDPGSVSRIRGDLTSGRRVPVSGADVPKQHSRPKGYSAM
jgi:hypothetical protein